MFMLQAWLLKGERKSWYYVGGPGGPVVVPGFDGGDGGDWISGPGGGVKRVRPNRKTPAHLVRHGVLGIQSRPRVWKRLKPQDDFGQYQANAKARRVHQVDEAYVPA